MNMKIVSIIAIALSMLSAIVLSLLKLYIAPNVGWNIIVLAMGVIISLVMGVLNMFKMFDFERKRQEFEVLMKIKDGFASDEMRKGMMELRKFERDHNWEDFVGFFVRLWDSDDPKSKEINLDSGRFFHHFRDNVFGLLDKIDDTFIKRAVHISQVELLLDVVDPIERKKAELYDTKYDENVAKECRRIFWDELEGRKQTLNFELGWGKK